MPLPDWAYNLDNFDPEPNEELVCTVCVAVLCDPVQTPCLHAFCRKCILKWLDKKKNCPICRTNFSPSRLKEVMVLVKNMIAQLTLKCTACKEKITLETCASHIKECPYQMVSCTSELCEARVQRQELQDHVLNKCLHRLVDCKNSLLGCKDKVPLSRIYYHTELVCRFELLQCPNPPCPLMIMQKDLLKHSFEECDYYLVKCENTIRGCTVTVPLYKSSSHFTVCPFKITQHANEPKQSDMEEHVFSPINFSSNRYCPNCSLEVPCICTSQNMRRQNRAASISDFRELNTGFISQNNYTGFYQVPSGHSLSSSISYQPWISSESQTRQHSSAISVACPSPSHCPARANLMRNILQMLLECTPEDQSINYTSCYEPNFNRSGISLPSGGILLNNKNIGSCSSNISGMHQCDNRVQSDHIARYSANENEALHRATSHSFPNINANAADDTVSQQYNTAIPTLTSGDFGKYVANSRRWSSDVNIDANQSVVNSSSHLSPYERKINRAPERKDKDKVNKQSDHKK